MRTVKDLLKFMAALDALTFLYKRHKISRDEYLSKFDKIVKAYEAIK